MRVALLNPPWPHPDDPLLWGVRAGSRWPHFQPRAAPGALPRYVPFPFFLAIAARLLQQAGHEVLLLDGVAGNAGLEEYYARVAAFQPGCVFVETSTPSLRHDLEVIHNLRRRLPRAVFAAGGTHPPELAARLLQEPSGPQAWLVGEYEATLTDLAAALECNAALPALPGLMSGAQAPRPALNPDVDALPMPLFEQLPMAGYSDPVCGLPAPVGQSWLSRGCPHGCSFCVWPQVIYGNRRYRPRRLDLALAEVELLVRDYGCESFYFDDDTANIGEARMLDLAAQIHRRGLARYPWAMMARADCMTPRMLEALAGAGLYSIKYGIESCSADLLNACNKGTHWPRLCEALRLTRDLGVKLHLTFTLGVPGETPATIRETIRFALETAPDTAQFSICTPFPGTAFYEECCRNRWLLNEDWEQFLGNGAAVVQTPWLSAAALEAGYREALAAWRQFQDERLHERQQRLMEKLRGQAAAGRRWRLLGDTDFAGFLLHLAPDLAESRAQDDPGAGAVRAPSPVPVIVSRHDEEKIFRRLQRSRPELAEKTLRLFGGKSVL